MRLTAAMGLLALAGCERAPAVSCQDLKRTYERAFASAVEAGAAKRFDEQERHMSTGQRAYLRMEDQGCCKEAGMCPPLHGL